MKTFKRSKIKVKTINDTNNVVYNDAFNILVVDPTETYVLEAKYSNNLTNFAIYAKDYQYKTTKRTHGDIVSSNSYRATPFINVSGYTYMTYLNTPESSNDPVIGLHFYDEQQHAITEIGVPLLPSGALPQETTLQIPEDAYKVRFCSIPAYANQLYIKLVKNKTVDNVVTIAEKVTALENKVPQAPTVDGQYILKATITNGTPVYSWAPISQN